MIIQIIIINQVYKKAIDKIMAKFDLRSVGNEVVLQFTGTYVGIPTHSEGPSSPYEA